MAVSVAFDQAASPIPGVNMEASATVTWDASTLVTGEVVDLSEQFSTIDAIIDLGASTIGAAVYIPRFFYAKGAAAATGVKMIAARIPLLEIDDTVDIAAQPLEAADALDFAALGTTRILVRGKAAV